MIAATRSRHPLSLTIALAVPGTASGIERSTAELHGGGVIDGTCADALIGSSLSANPPPAAVPDDAASERPWPGRPRTLAAGPLPAIRPA